MNDERKPLELPDKSVSDSVLEQLSTLRRVRDALEQRGVPVNMKPEFDIPDLPLDLSSITESELGNLYSKLLSWDNYFTQELAFAEAEVKECKNKLEVTIVKLSGGKKKRDHSMDVDDRVLKAREMLQEAEQTAGILKSTHSIFSNRVKMISRSIELRKMELEKSMREEGISRTKRPGHHYPSTRHTKFDPDKR